MPNLIRFAVYIALFLLITLNARPASAYVLSAQGELPVLSAPSESREGYFVLKLSDAPRQALWVEYSTDPKFTKVVRTYPWFGDFDRMTLSGFSNGEHFFRLRSDSHPQANSTQLSNVVKVRVDHYPLWQAIGLFSVGLVVFIFLAGLIWTNHQRSRNDD
ncbi:hypothetical protein [Pseudidiomarina sp.]|uniref:hypothetical protein n=1 Tax=Pseudidiomarina sp. TaxID=2081707 RepID=UPI003A97D479